jgi:exopolyphosphatase / guanosine-5'-triphosphate,3'-diphosphate pyrophosphatase
MNIASIDIGTNTVILLIAEISHHRFFPLKNEYRVPRIGKGLENGKKISQEKIAELVHILVEFKEIIRSYNCEVILAIGTNAFRISSNGSTIIKVVKDELGIQINIVSSLKEAEYSFLGAVSDYHYENKDSLVIDIGGGSTELICGKLNQIRYMNSFQTGVVSGTECFFRNDPPLPFEISNFEDFLSSTFVKIDIPASLKAIAIAGTPTTLACIQKGLKVYNDNEVEGSILKQVDIYELKEELSHLSSKQIKGKYLQVVSGREDVLLAGTIILYLLMKQLNLSEVIVSTKGIRYGVIVEFIQMNYHKTDELFGRI